MNDLRIYKNAWKTTSEADLHGTQQRLLAAGSEKTSLLFSAGRVSSINFSSNLTLEARRFSKKARVKKQLKAQFGDFSWLEQLRQPSDNLFEPADDSVTILVEPRHVEGHASENAYALYDSELAQAQPALMFDRLWHAMGPVFKKGILFDGSIDWFNGRTAWNGAPLPFAWADATTTYFSPCPRIDEAFEFYCESAPERRLRVLSTAFQVDPAPNFEAACDVVTRLEKAPYCAVIPENVDAVVLSPRLVIKLLTRLLPAFAANGEGLEKFACSFGHDEPVLGQNLILRDDPLFSCFAHDVMPYDARGYLSRSITLVQNGDPVALAASDVDVKNISGSLKNQSFARLKRVLNTLSPNGRALTPDGHSSTFYPVLQAVRQETLPQYDVALFKDVAERTLVFDDIQFFEVADRSRGPYLFFTEGGMLYENGVLFGNTPPQKIGLSINQLLAAAEPASSPLAYGGFAVCALCLDPQFLFSDGKN